MLSLRKSSEDQLVISGFLREHSFEIQTGKQLLTKQNRRTEQRVRGLIQAQRVTK